MATGRPSDMPGGGDLTGTNPSGIRALNQRLVLTLLRRGGALPKAEIARQTGLSAQAISVIIRALEQDGLLIRGEPQRGRIGQPSVPIALNPSGAFFLGLKVGRRSAELILTDFVGRIVDRAMKVYAYPDFDEVLSFFKTSADRLRAGLGPEGAARTAGVGVAIPFHLWSWAPLLGVEPEKMANWKTRDLQAELAALTDMPVLLQNDATSACSAELVFGTEPLPANFLHFFMAFFIGGGLVLNNSLFTGSTGNAAGFGPLIVPGRDGRMHPLIDLASLVQLEDRLKQDGRDGMILWNSPEGWDIPAQILEPWLDEAAHALARASHAAMAILDVDAVLIDGWMPVPLRTRLVDRVAEAFDRIDRTGVNRPDFRAGTVGAGARALGAASLPLSARWIS